MKTARKKSAVKEAMATNLHLITRHESHTKTPGPMYRCVCGNFEQSCSVHWLAIMLPEAQH